MLEFRHSHERTGVFMPLSHVEHFLVAADNIEIELNYDAAEAEGLKAEVMASDFARS